MCEEEAKPQFENVSEPDALKEKISSAEKIECHIPKILDESPSHMLKPKSMDTPAFGIKPMFPARKEIDKHKSAAFDE